MPTIDPDLHMPYRLVLDDWSAGVKGASQTIYFDSPQAPIVWDDTMLAAQTGAIPYCQSTQSFIHGTGGYKFEIGAHRFRLPASCNDEVDEPVWQMLFAFTPKDRWSGYPSMVGYDPAVDSTFPRAFRITAYHQDGSIHHIFQMQRDGIPINDPSMGQTRNLTTRWRPFVNTANMLYHCSHRLKLSSDARKYYAGTVARFWHRPTISKAYAIANAALPVFGTGSGQINGFAHFLAMPQWAANTSDADFAADPKTDPNINFNSGNDPSGNYTSGAHYPTHAVGYASEHGGYNAGHEPVPAFGGGRFDRFPAPSQLTYFMTEPAGVRPQGSVPWRTLLDEYGKGFFSLGYHHVLNAKSLAMIPTSEAGYGVWGHFHGYYNGGDNPPSDPQHWIDMHGWCTNQVWRASDFDRDGLHHYNGYVTDSQHSYHTPGWFVTHFNSVAHAVSQKLKWFAQVMSWNKYMATPGTNAANQGDPFVFQRHHTWRWKDLAFMWKQGSSHALLVSRAEIEEISRLELESFYDNVVIPCTTPAHASYNLPFFAGLRNLGVTLTVATSGGNHYLTTPDDDKRFYFSGMLVIARKLGWFDRMRAVNAKCAAALDFAVDCYAKGGAQRFYATKGLRQYGQVTPSVPVATALTVPADWFAVAASMQAGDASDMVHNADGSAFLGAPDNYGNRERWLYQHLLQQCCYAYRDHFADYNKPYVAEAVAMSDEMEAFVETNLATSHQEYGQRFIAAGPMLADAISVPEIVPTVTDVVVSPAAVTLASGTQQFTAVANGANSPPQGFTWTADIGSVASGLYAPPARTSAVQTATVTATSTFNPQVKGMATVTIPALVVTPPVVVPPVVTPPVVIIRRAFAPQRSSTGMPLFAPQVLAAPMVDDTVIDLVIPGSSVLASTLSSVSLKALYAFVNEPAPRSRWIIMKRTNDPIRL